MTFRSDRMTLEEIRIHNSRVSKENRIPVPDIASEIQSEMKLPGVTAKRVVKAGVRTTKPRVKELC